MIMVGSSSPSLRQESPSSKSELKISILEVLQYQAAEKPKSSQPSKTRTRKSKKNKSASSGGLLPFFSKPQDDTEVIVNSIIDETQNEEPIGEQALVAKRALSGSGLLGILNGTQSGKKKKKRNALSEPSSFDEQADFLSNSETSFSEGSPDRANHSVSLSQDDESLLFTFKSNKLKSQNTQPTVILVDDKPNPGLRVSLKELLNGNSSDKRRSEKIEENGDSLVSGKTVTLKVRASFLKLIEAKMIEQGTVSKNPFYTAGSVQKSTNNGISFFSEVRERSKEAKKLRNIPPIMSKLEKQELMHIRAMSKEEFHVLPNTEPCPRTTLGNKRKTATTVDYEKPLSLKIAYHRYTGEKYVVKSVPSNDIRQVPDGQLWAEALKPSETSNCLIDSATGEFIRSWLEDLFGLLHKRYQLSERSLYLKEKYEGTSKRIGEMVDFIVSDELENDVDLKSHTEMALEFGILKSLDDSVPFVPLMILNGPVGCGKTSCVYAIAKELHGYVHEISTNQDRNKRSLNKLLKDLSTNHVVHLGRDQNSALFTSDYKSDSGFTNGLILFENADILFYEQDKGFWDLFNAILCITRKPIVLTCSDLDGIPQTVIDICKDQSTLIDVGRAEKPVLIDYLRSSALSFGYELGNDVLEELVDENSLDLRKCLSNLQMVCQSSAIKDGCINQIHLSEKYLRSMGKERREADLTKVAEELDSLSLFDVVSENSKSMMEWREIDYSDANTGFDPDIGSLDTKGRYLTSEPSENLGFELNIGCEMSEMILEDPAFVWPKEYLSIEALHTKMIHHKAFVLDLFVQFINSKLLRSSRSTRRILTRDYDSSNSSNSYNNLALIANVFIQEIVPFLRLESFVNLALDGRNKAASKSSNYHHLVAHGIVRSLWYLPDVDLNRKMLTSSVMNLKELLNVLKEWTVKHI